MKHSFPMPQLARHNDACIDMYARAGYDFVRGHTGLKNAGA
ncbi:hypothetical protein Z947_1724 [Sulfitobacter geojensis]|nr:hypothetical protein Z947_1724 [Sulfitobacter geojensis]